MHASPLCRTVCLLGSVVVTLGAGVDLGVVVRSGRRQHAGPDGEGGSLWWHGARRKEGGGDGGAGAQPKPNYGAIRPQPRPDAAPRGSGEGRALVRS